MWPESDEARGRAALRSVLSGLRKTLEETAEPSERAHLFPDEGSLGLAFGPDLLELDLRALETAHSLALTNPSMEGLEDDARAATCSPGSGPALRRTVGISLRALL